MKSSKLLDVLNDVKQPLELLTRLAEEHFAITDLTEEGDSVLHVLAKSNQSRNFGFSAYIKVLLAAGANANALDKRGLSFLSDYSKHAESYDLYNTLNLLLVHKDFDVNQTLETDQTFFELISNLRGYNSSDLFKKLIRHKEFNPNHKTSKHNSILLHMISEDLYCYRSTNDIYDVSENVKTNPNIKNNIGQTALTQILSDTQYKDMKLITALINHEQCEINTLDRDGNNYLQSAIIFCKYQAEEIAALLINKGIDVAHKNNEGKSLFDLINENKANRSDYANKILLIEILKLHPLSLLDKNSSGKTILSVLLKDQDYTITSELSALLGLCKNLNNSREPLKNIISDCFNDFRQNGVSEQTINSLTKAIIDANIHIDVEYCLAIIAIRAPFLKETCNNIRKLIPEVNLSTIISFVTNLTHENSDERLQALGNVYESSLHLGCFDDAVLAWEEQSLRSKSNQDINNDSKMFGHLFSLSGSIPSKNSHIKLTGSLSSVSAPFMVHLMNAYVFHCEKNGKHKEHLNSIREVRNMTVKAMRYYFMSQPGDNYYSAMQSSKDDFLSSVIADSKNSGVEIITGWHKHAVNLIFKEDNFYRNNGGGCSTDTTTEHYKISNTSNLKEEVLAKLYKDRNKESNKTYIQRDLHDILGLTFASSITGEFQTVGNCGLKSLLIALKIKYRLFLPEVIADELYADTIQFFEKYYLEEYLSRYSNNAILPHLLIRLIIQKLIPEEKFELASRLIKEHVTSEASQEIMQIALMLKQWKLRIKGRSTEQFETQLSTLGVILNPKMNSRLHLLDRILNDKVTIDDLDELRSWPAEKQSFQGNHLVHFAVMNNNLALATSLIQMFPEAVDQTNWSDKEPLCLAKSVEMIDILVKAGASTARTDYDNALDCAIKANKPDLVCALLKHGVKPSEYSVYYAASKDPKIIQALIKFHPSSMTTTTHNYRTPIHAAAISGHNENLHTLVYYGGVNPAANDVNGISPLHLALKNEHHDTAKILIQYPSTLFNAPYRGDLVSNMTKDTDIKRMIEFKGQEKKADLESFDRFKKSNPGVIEEEMDYLIIAIRFNDTAAIRGFLLTYPNIKVVNSSKLYSTAPLTEAIYNLASKKGVEYEDAFKIVQLLLKTPAIDVNALMGSSEPILFIATSIDDVSVLELFLADPNLDPNRQDNVGYTALHDAVERGHLNCVKRLLQDERVDSTLVNGNNETAADLKSFKPNVIACRNEVAKHQQLIQQKKISLH